MSLQKVLFSIIPNVVPIPITLLGAHEQAYFFGTLLRPNSTGIHYEIKFKKYALCRHRAYDVHVMLIR